MQEKLCQSGPEELEKLLAVVEPQLDELRDVLEFVLLGTVTRGHVAHSQKLLRVITVTKKIFERAWFGVSSSRQQLLDSMTNFSINADQVKTWLEQAQEEECKL